MAKQEEVLIPKPNFKTIAFTIRGTTPYIQEQFSEKAKRVLMQKKEEAGKKVKVREKWNRDEEAENLAYRFREGGYGVPVSHVKGAMVRACSLVGLPMTKAKMLINIDGDGFDVVDNKPLIKFKKGGKYQVQTEGFSVGMSAGKNDVHARPMFPEGWEADVRITFDADILTSDMITNLLYRAGIMCGIGAWRPQRGGQWGTFELINQK
jgi:hypothetical protein